MTFRALSTTGLAALICLCAPAVFAQVTAEELWAEWQAQGAATAQPVTAASVTPTSDGLTLMGVSSRYVDSEVSVLTLVDEISLVETGDGSVDIALSQPYRVNLTFPVDEPAGQATVEILINYENLAITAGGPVEARAYTYAADLLTMTEGGIDSGGAPVLIDINGEMLDFDAEYVVDGRDLNNLGITSTQSIGSFILGVDMRPDDPTLGFLKAGFAVTDLASGGTASLGAMAALADTEALPAGFAADAEITYGSLGFSMELQQPGELIRFANATSGGSFSSVISESVISFGVTATDSQWQMIVPDVPLPIEFSSASSEIRFELPVAADPAPQEFGARVAYEGITLTDGIWGMMDPAQAIPRDPISAVADVSGLVRVLVDLMRTDPGTLNAPPGELRALNINEFRFAAAGAEMTGTGALTFAEGQIIPMPEGRIDVALSGGLALLDQLQATGIVPAEELIGIRGILGAFTRPGPRPDTLESTVEFGPGGSITANGLPLQ